MAMTQSTTVVGVFDNHTMATQAIAELQSAGFSNEQIGYVVRDSSGTIDTVTAESVGGGLLSTFKGMGIPEADAHYYHGEFESSRTIVTVQAADHQAVARDILQRNGAYDATTRRGMSSSTDGTFDPTVRHAGTFDPTARDKTESDPTVRHAGYEENLQI